MNDEQPPITNCHVHIFTGDHVPSFLARTIVPWPLYYLVNIRWLLALMVWLKRTFWFIYSPEWKTFTARIKQVRSDIAHSQPLSVISFVFHAWLTIEVFFFLLAALVHGQLVKATDGPRNWVDRLHDALDGCHLLFPLPTWTMVLASLYLITFVKPARRFLLKALGLFWKVLGAFPSAQFKALWDRYKLIVRFSLYGVGKEENAQGRSGQSSVLHRLRRQYPKGTHFVILPMDMEYMGAGRVARKGSYCDQMNELTQLKASSTYGSLIHPFIFIDPRRIKEKGAVFLDWSHDAQGKVALNECCVKRYLDARFCGFKIYPALGYYPFDMYLLPLWLYAAQNGLPIMTHCIRGVIYYRGRIKREWDRHPVFQRQRRTKDKQGAVARTEPLYEPLPLQQTRNVDFQENFTHPLNYLCLLNKDLLLEFFCQLAAKYPPDSTEPDATHFRRLSQLFGFDLEERTLAHDLSQLKICLAHFGGEDEWARYMEADTNDYSQQLNTEPCRGLDFDIKDAQGQILWGRLERHWSDADWYSIICSLMLEYPNVYADISYIVHDMSIKPLLVRTLDHPCGQNKLGSKVLFGTDFYVVRNHHSDKEILANLIAALPAHFDDLARVNPRAYLSYCMPPLPASSTPPVKNITTEQALAPPPSEEETP